MPAPSDFPDFATDATYSSGVHSGQPNKIAPTAGLSAQGYYPGKAPGPQPFNWWRNLVGLWVRWLDEDLNAEKIARAAADDAIALWRPLQRSYTPTAVTGETKIEEIDPLDIRGEAIRIGLSGSACVLIVNFRVPYEANSSGQKWFNLPFSAGASGFAPASDFSDGFDVSGHGSAVSGTASTPVEIFALTGSKNIQVRWTDTDSSGLGNVRGTFSARFIPEG